VLIPLWLVVRLDRLDYPFPRSLVGDLSRFLLSSEGTGVVLYIAAYQLIIRKSKTHSILLSRDGEFQQAHSVLFISLPSLGLVPLHLPSLSNFDASNYWDVEIGG
jgi:hypothetical protein